ncbi:MAG: pseudouridine synthase [Bacteroidia bacterium]
MQSKNNSGKRESNSGSRPAAKTTTRSGSGSSKSSSSYSKSGSFGSKKPFDSKGKFSDDKPSFTKKKSFGDDKFSDSPRKPSNSRSYGKDKSEGSWDKKPFEKKLFGDDKFSDSPRKPSNSRSYGKDKSEGSWDKKPFEKKSFGDDKFSDSPRKPSNSRSFSKDKPEGSWDKKPFEKKSFGDDKFSDSPRKPSNSRSFSKDKPEGSWDKKPFEKKSFGDDKFSDSPRKPSNSRSFSKDSFEKKPYKGKDDYEIKGKKSYHKKDNNEPEKEERTYQSKPKNIETKEYFSKRGISEDATPLRSKSKRGETEFKSVRKRNDVAEKNKGVNKKTASEDLDFGEIRLNRFIANAGICSRREADTLITAGLVNINGTVITEMGYKVKAGDDIRYNGQRLNVEDKVYIIMNKPKDAITTAIDPEGRKTVFDLIEGKLAQRVFAVGRLDRNTTGVLLLTNDGDLAQRLMHPKFDVEKVYVATLNKPLTKADMWQMASGIELEDGPIKPDALAYSDEEKKDIVGIEIHSGRNRIIHRMFEHMGYLVDKLDRVVYAGLTKAKLKRGEWRELNDKELKALRKHVKIG